MYDVVTSMFMKIGLSKEVCNRVVTFRPARVGHSSIRNILRLDDIESITALVMMIRSFEMTY